MDGIVLCIVRMKNMKPTECENAGWTFHTDGIVTWSVMTNSMANHGSHMRPGIYLITETNMTAMILTYDMKTLSHPLIPPYYTSVTLALRMGTHQ